MASRMSFVELYSCLSKYVDDPRRRFRMCLRVKRGMGDTGAGGGFFKDKVYFEGAVKILQKRREIDWKLMLAGKLSTDDLARSEIKDAIRRERLIYPYFARDEAKYAAALDRIAEVNFIQ